MIPREILEDILSCGCNILANRQMGKTNLAKVIISEMYRKLGDEYCLFKIFDTAQVWRWSFLNSFLMQEINDKTVQVVGNKDVIFDIEFNDSERIMEFAGNQVLIDYNANREKKKASKGKLNGWNVYVLEEAQNSLGSYSLSRVAGRIWLKMLSECYSDDTEILTDDGWKLFKDLDRTEKIATLNPETNELEYQKPTRYIAYPYNGKMLHLKGLFYDLIVTPNHNLWVKEIPLLPRPIHKYDFNGKQQFKFVKAKDLIHPFYRAKRTAKWKGKEIKTFKLQPTYLWGVKTRSLVMQMDDWLAFFGIWLAEGDICTNKKGTCHSIRIHQSNKKNLNLIKKLIEKLGFTARVGTNYVSFSNKQIHTYLMVFGKSGDKFIPDYIKHLSPRQIKIFLDYYLLGDGTHYNDYYSRASSKSKKLIDDLQEIILKVGFAGHIIKRKKGKSSWYDLAINHSKKVGYEPLILNYNREWIDYSGMIYCVEVPKHHLLYVRRRGKPIWSGNSANFNLAFIFIGQRPADITTKAIERMQTYFIGRTTGDNNTNKLKRIIGRNAGKEQMGEPLVELAKRLERGEFIFWNGAHAKRFTCPKFEDLYPNQKPEKIEYKPKRWIDIF